MTLDLRSIRHPVLAFAVGLIGCVVAAEPAPGRGPVYRKQGANYTVRYELASSLPAAALLEVCFGFEHLQAVCMNCPVRLVKSGPDWQTVEYRIDYKVCKSTATYLRTLDRNKQAVRCTLVNHQVIGMAMPAMISSDGGYRIRAADQGSRLVYEQTAVLERGIGALEWAMIQAQGNEWFAGFERHVRQQEGLQRKMPVVDEPTDPSKP